MAPRERNFPINGLNIAALEWPGEGLPVIALHGWLDNAASFLPLAPQLQGVHLLAPDLVGHGCSDHLPPAAGYHLADNCRWVVPLADAMGWERFVLLGHSMGAAAASITAAAVPQRLAGLILLDGLAPLAFTPEQELLRLRQLFEPSRERGTRPFDSLDSAVKVRRRLGRFPIGEAAARLIAERGMAEMDGGFVWRHDPRLAGPSTHYYSAEQAEGILRGIETEVLLLSAEEGAFRDWKGLERRKACIGKLRHSLLPGGHHFHMESPQAVAIAINDYLQSIRGVL